MKKVLLILALAGLALTSCEKEDGIKLSDLDGIWLCYQVGDDEGEETHPGMTAYFRSKESSVQFFYKGSNSAKAKYQVDGKKLKMTSGGETETMTITQLSKKVLKIKWNKHTQATLYHVGNCLPGSWTSGDNTLVFKKDETMVWTYISLSNEFINVHVTTPDEGDYMPKLEVYSKLSESWSDYLIAAFTPEQMKWKDGSTWTKIQ